MTDVYEVPPNRLIEKLSVYIAENIDEVTPPSWTPFVKTGVYKEHPPNQENWWYIRCASLLRKIYVRAPIGIAKLKVEYGGRTGRRKRPEHSKPGSGNIVRKALQQLEKADLVKTVPKKGRVMTAKGVSLLDKMAKELMVESQKQEK